MYNFNVEREKHIMPQDTYDFNRIDLNEIYSLFHTKDERRLDSVKEFIEAEN